MEQPTPLGQRRQPDFHIQVGGRHHSRHWLLVAAAAAPSYSLQTLSHKIIIFLKNRTLLYFLFTPRSLTTTNLYRILIFYGLQKLGYQIGVNRTESGEI